MSINNSDTSEPNNEDSNKEIHFGVILKEERLRQKLSLEEISGRTAINLKHLQAIENGDRRKLPADVFNIGFIKIYSAALGISPTESLKLYDQEWGFSNGMRGAEIYLGHEYMAQSSSVFADRTALAFIFIVILVAATFLLLKVPILNFSDNDVEIISTPKPNLSKNETQVAPPKNLSLSSTNQDNATIITSNDSAIETIDNDDMKDVSEKEVSDEEDLEEEEVNLQDIYANDENSDNSSEPNVDSQSRIEVLPTKIPNKIIPSKEAALGDNSLAKLADSPGDSNKSQSAELTYAYLLEASFAETTWMTITIDDQPSAEYTFKPNETYIWQAKENLKLFLGNTGGVNLYLNDEPVEFIKRSGKTFKLVIP